MVISVMIRLRRMRRLVALSVSMGNAVRVSIVLDFGWCLEKANEESFLAVNQQT